MENQFSSLTLSAAQVMQALSISRSTLARYIKRGIIKPIAGLRVRKFPRTQLEKLLAS